MDYIVNWSINIQADDPHDAAKQAREIQLDPESIATVFQVTDAAGVGHHVDLHEGVL